MATPAENLGAKTSDEVMAETNNKNVNASSPKMFALGLYLLLFLLTGIFFLGNLMMAEPCDKSLKKEESNANKDVSNLKEETNSNSNSVNSNTNISNTSNTNASVNGNTKPSNTPTNTDKTKTPNQTPTPTPKETKPELPQYTVPDKLVVNFWGFFQKTQVKDEKDEKICKIQADETLLNADGYLFLVVLFSGLIGSAIRGVFSLVRHIGIGDFSFRWLWFYLTLPFSGSALSLIIYFVLRGGFYNSAVGKALILNVFSFAALAMVTGLFTENAMLKLKQVADILLAPAEDKSNRNPNNK